VAVRGPLTRSCSRCLYNFDILLHYTFHAYPSHHDSFDRIRLTIRNPNSSRSLIATFKIRSIISNTQMSSTLPKYVQAQGSSSATGSSSDQRGDGDSRQRCIDFLSTYRQLPDDFLRIPASYYPNPPEQSMAIPGSFSDGTPLVDMIDISVVEAQLVKNYGLLRMDLYCKIRVGHYVAETATCQNGARNPRWDGSGVYQFALKPGIDSFHLEIYDEKQFSNDEKIAWLHESIPAEIFQGVTVERWFPLSGRLGHQKEGSILLVLSHKRVPLRTSNFGRAIQHHPDSMPMFLPPPSGQPHLIGGRPTVLPVDPNIPTYTLPQQPPTSGGFGVVPQQQQPQEPRTASEEDINQLSEMFPSIDKSIIKSVLENHNLDKEGAISALLAMG
jgi:toll-interacting protein